MRPIFIITIGLLLVNLGSATWFTCPEDEYTVEVEEDNTIDGLEIPDNHTAKLEKGTYTVKDHIKLGTNTCLVGEGSGDDGTKLVVDGKPESTYDGVIRIQSESNVTLTGFSLNITDCEADKFCVFGMKVKEAKNLSVANVTLIGGLKDTVFIENSEHVLLHNTFLSNATRNCLNMKTTHNVTVTTSRAQNCIYHGFAFEDGSMVMLTNSSASDVGHEIEVEDEEGKKERQYHGSGAYFSNMTVPESPSPSSSPTVTPSFTHSPSSTASASPRSSPTASSTSSPTVTSTISPTVTPSLSASYTGKYAVHIHMFMVEKAYFAGIWAKTSTIIVSNTNVTDPRDKTTKDFSCFRVDEDTEYKLCNNTCDAHVKRCLRIDEDGSRTTQKCDDECLLS